MADDSETMKVKMLRSSGRNDEIQWLEYRPSFAADIVKLSWELDTMEVELDTSVADYLLRAGYAAPLPQGSAPEPDPVQEPEPEEPVKEPETTIPPPWKQDETTVDHAESEPSAPPAPSWLKPSGD
jgi:hypothetical protein